MAGTITFAMIKPDAVKDKHVGAIINMIEQAGFTIQAMRLAHLTPQAAGMFYLVHKERPFYEQMCAFIASGPVVAMVLQKENAVAEFDHLKETICKRLATSRALNAVHGADTDKSAGKEIALLFPEMYE